MRADEAYGKLIKDVEAQIARMKEATWQYVGVNDMALARDTALTAEGVCIALRLIRDAAKRWDED